MNIFAYKCKQCGELHYPYRMVCKNCGKNKHNEFEPVPLPRKGKLLTYTELYNPPADFAVTKLGLGIVELDNGIRITGQVRVDKPELGMPVCGKVETVRCGDYSEQYGMVFYKA